MGLRGRRSLVAGALGGIGEAISRKLANMGSELVLVARDRERLSKFEGELRANPGGVRVWSRALDLSSPNEIENGAKEILSNVGRIDVVVYNAAVTSPHHFLDLQVEEWDRILNTNLRGAYLLLRWLVPSMMENKYGRIVVISSIVAKTGGLGRANLAYTASKAGLLGLTKNLARFLASYNITVNAVAPSFVETQMLRETGLDKRLDELRRMHPVGRIGTPEDVANVVAFLVSDSSSFITGETIDVNGGMFMD